MTTFRLPVRGWVRRALMPARSALTALLLLAPPGMAAVPVEVTHPVGDFLRRLEEKGIVEPGFWSTLPRDEAEVARVLNEAARADKAARLGEAVRFWRRLTGRDPSPKRRLSNWDRRRLERYLDEFDPARKRRSRLHYEDGSPFVLHGSTDFYMGIFLRDSVPGLGHNAFGRYGATAQATYSDFAWVTASAYAGSERHIQDRFTAGYQFNPAMGLPYSVTRDGLEGSNHDVMTFDAARVVLGVGTSVGKAHMRLEVGQDWNQWGPGRWQHSTLGPRPHFWIADAPGPGATSTGYTGTPHPGAHRSGYRMPGEGPPLPQIRLRFGSERWEYTKVVASRRGLWKDSLATLFAHRLQVRLGAVRLGVTEMTAVGTRSPEAVYFLPVMPQRVAEHEASDRDNAMMSADAEWVLRGHGRVYGEVLIDDFSGPPLNYWGNKLAWVLGGAWQDPWGLPAELQGEFAHVDPWVYGHDANNTQMQSFGALLGSSLPPNSHSWRAAVLFPLPGGVEGVVNGQVRQRDLKSPGSTLFDGNPGSAGAPDDLKDFLVQDVETRVVAEAGVTWRWHRYVSLSGGVGGLWVKNFRGEAGEDLATATARGEVMLRY